MTTTQLPKLSQAEVKRGAAALFYLLNWQNGFDNEKAVRTLREAKLEVAVVSTTKGDPRVHEAVLNAFRDLAGRSAVWDDTAEIWRTRRKDDPT